MFVTLSYLFRQGADNYELFPHHKYPWQAGKIIASLSPHQKVFFHHHSLQPPLFLYLLFGICHHLSYLQTIQLLPVVTMS